MVTGPEFSRPPVKALNSSHLTDRAEERTGLVLGIGAPGEDYFETCENFFDPKLDTLPALPIFTGKKRGVAQ